MTKQKDTPAQSIKRTIRPKPSLEIKKVGIVSRDYNIIYPNGYRDFSHSFAQVLKLLDEKDCDAALFSLFSIIPRESFNPYATFNRLRNIKAIFLEEFMDNNSRDAKRNVVYYRTSSKSRWGEYEFCQVFGSLAGISPQKMDDFVKNEIPRRILGKCCVLLCGETNGVKYSKSDKRIHDTYGLRSNIPNTVNVVLNPIHDRMIRPEMKLKRQFFSEQERWVISVWNKGKLFKDGKTRDGNDPAWIVFYDGNRDPVELPKIQNDLGVEIAILDVRST